jgi:hypothetical protein
MHSDEAVGLLLVLEQQQVERGVNSSSMPRLFPTTAAASLRGYKNHTIISRDKDFNPVVLCDISYHSPRSCQAAQLQNQRQ